MSQSRPELTHATDNPTRILIIEDEGDMRTNLTVMLSMEGFDVRAAANGAEGLEIARQHLPDLVICDVMMPGMDGHAVLEALRGDPALDPIPFLFLTARGTREDLRVGMNLGADDYLTKPVSHHELLTAIHARLTRHRSVEQSVLLKAELKPDFSASLPLEALGLTPREAEVLLWIAQGKSNSEISTILGISLKTAKIHVGHIFEKLGTDNRHAAALCALDWLSTPRKSTTPPPPCRHA
jgi:DNA-binding NarL/FixJ family response regulator